MRVHRFDESVKREQHKGKHVKTCTVIGVRFLFFLDLYHTSGKFRLVKRQRPRREPRAGLLRRHVREKDETRAQADLSCNAGHQKIVLAVLHNGNNCTTNPQPLARVGGREKWRMQLDSVKP